MSLVDFRRPRRHDVVERLVGREIHDGICGGEGPESLVAAYFRATRSELLRPKFKALHLNRPPAGLDPDGSKGRAEVAHVEEPLPRHLGAHHPILAFNPYVEGAPLTHCGRGVHSGDMPRCIAENNPPLTYIFPFAPQSPR